MPRFNHIPREEHRLPIGHALRLRKCVRSSSRWVGYSSSKKYIPNFFPSHKRRKETYPIYIKMSSQRNLPERSNVLHHLIGKNFRTLRSYHNVSLEEVSDATHLSIHKLRQLELGKLRIRPSILVAVCDYFHVLIDCMVRQDLSQYQ
jgi:Helix-turn-helix domain